MAGSLHLAENTMPGCRWTLPRTTAVLLMMVTAISGANAQGFSSRLPSVVDRVMGSLPADATAEDRAYRLHDDPELVHLQMQAGILIAVAMWITRSNVHTVQGAKDGLTTQFPECDTYPHPLAESCDRSGGAMRFRHTDAAGTQFTGVVFFRHEDDHDWTREQLSAYFLEHVSGAVYDCTRDGPVPVDTTGLARCIDDGIRYSGGRTPRSTLAVLEPPGLTVQEVVISFNERSVLLPYHYDVLQGNQGVPPPFRLSIPNTQEGGRLFLLAVVLLLPGAP